MFIEIRYFFFHNQIYFTFSLLDSPLRLQLQNNTMRCPLEFEVHHMIEVHILKKNSSTIIARPIQTIPSTLSAGKLNVRSLPGDLLSTRRNTETTLASTSPATAAEANRLQIANVVSLVPYTKTISMAPAAQTTPPTKRINISLAPVDNTTASTPMASASPLTAMSTLRIAKVFSLSGGSTNQTSAPVVQQSHVAANHALLYKTLNAPRGNILKPWLPASDLQKSLQDAQAMLANERNLYATYKCMAINCTFACIQSFFMFAHFKRHENIEAKTAAAAVSSFPAAMPQRTWLECAYCELKPATADELVLHIATEHEHCLFQCSFCFYRTCTAHNVLEHQATMHPDRMDRRVLACLAVSNPVQNELLRFDADRAQNVRQLECDRCE